MRRIRVVLLLGCLLAVAGVVAPAPASACSCAGGTTAEFFARVDAVFTGFLSSRSVDRPPGSLGSSSDPALHVFAVETVLKGSPHERQGVVSPESGASCGLELAGEGPFAVFATRDATLGDTPFTTLAEGQYAAFLCGGTAELTPALETELRALAAPEEAPEAAPLPGAAGTELPASGPGTIQLLVAGVALGGMALLLGRWWRHRPGSGRTPRG